MNLFLSTSKIFSKPSTASAQIAFKNSVHSQHPPGRFKSVAAGSAISSYFVSVEVQGQATEEVLSSAHCLQLCKGNALLTSVRTHGRFFMGLLHKKHQGATKLPHCVFCCKAAQKRLPFF